MLKLTEFFESNVETVTVDANALKKKIRGYEKTISNLIEETKRLETLLENNKNAYENLKRENKKLMKSIIFKDEVIKCLSKQQYQKVFLDLEA